MLGSVLITGGSGFLGKALTRRILADNLSERICIYSRGEHAQADMRSMFKDDARLRFFIGDVRDPSRLKRAMHRVDTVIHAAALKRIEVGHYNPVELARTNIDGTINVIEAAQDAGVKKVVFVSSDKAHQPCSAYGYSKAFGESLILAANNTSGGSTKYAVTRYGNVWNSAGSIVPKWRAMIGAGSTSVPITDPDCTRFFMRVEDAVELVLTVAREMKGGEIVVPDLPAFRVGDLATAFGVAMEVTGLPAWEKKHEAMSDQHTSDKARRMTIDELQAELGKLPNLRLVA